MTNTSKKAKIQAVKNSVKGLKTASEIVAQVKEEISEKVAKVKTDRQQAAQEKREWLRGISAQFQEQQKIMELTGAEYIPSINEMLRAYYEKQNNITELNTFDQWKEKGYQVRRGEKAYLFLGKPKAKYAKLQAEPTEQDEQGEPTEPITAKANDFYPICYLFDISQCRQITA